MKNRKLLLMMLFSLISICLLGQVIPQKHVITLKIKNLPNDSCFLVNYFGDKQYVQDTAFVQNGEVVFKNPKGFPAGLYMLVQKRQRLFEFVIVDQETEFTLITDATDYIGKMNIVNSEENKLFYEYLHFLDKKRAESEPVRSKLIALKTEYARMDSLAKKKKSKTTIDSTEFKLGLKELSRIDEEVKSYMSDFIKTHSGAFVGRFIKSTQEIQVPDAPKLSNGRVDSTFAYRYYKKHYWDNYNLLDERLLYAPGFHNRLKSYFDNMIIPNPDSVKRDINELIDRVENNKELFKYIVFTATNQYETSTYMGMDAVFVDLVEKYYNTKKAFWVDSVSLYKYKKRAEQLSLTLLGKKVPNVIMQDTTIARSYSLHDVKAKFTIVYIWDPNCGHCQKETPKLLAIYNKEKEKYGLEVYAIGSGFSEMKPWVDYIKKNQLPWINVADLFNKTNYHYLFDIYSTPVVYLLDKNKNIIAKRIQVDQIIDFLDHWQKVEANKTSSK